MRKNFFSAVKQERRSRFISFFSDNLRTVIISVVVFIGVILSVILYPFFLQSTLDTSMVNSLRQVSSQSSQTLLKEITLEVRNLRTLSTLIANEPTFDIDSELKDLSIICAQNKFKRMGIAKPSGVAQTTDGETFNVMDRDFFHLSLDGQTVISDTLRDKADQEKINVYSTPIVKEGVVVAVLFATFSTDIYSEILGISSFDGQGYSYVVKKNGDAIVTSSDPSSFKNLVNIFSSIEPFSKKDSIAKFRSDMENQKSGHIIFSNQQDKYMYYHSMGINDWVLLTIVPSSVISSQSSSIMHQTYFLCALISLSLIALMMHLIRLQIRNKKELEHIAYDDPLTGGYNYSKFKLLATQLLSRKSSLNQYAMLSIDINKFKYVNEAFGFEEGNSAIKAVWTMLHSQLHTEELLCRLNSDNYVLLLAYQTEENLIERLNKIRQVSREQKQFLKLPYELVLSIGVYELQSSDVSSDIDIDILSDLAEIARKTISGIHATTYVLYDKTIHQRILEDKAIENCMAAALADREFVAYCQPKYDAQTKQLTGAEALVRWIKPDGSMIYPDQFIPLFESNGFITELDKYMFENICRLIRSWIDRGIKPVPISVNISRLHFYNVNFVRTYKNILKKYNLPERMVELELTESLLLNDFDSLSLTIEELRKAGFAILMDDFGTGYSSLTVLKNLSIDTLKLDKSFVDDIENKKGQQVIANIIRLSQDLNMKVTAEGVETQTQYNFLKEVSCDEIQGYYFAKPMPVSDFETLLSATDSDSE